MQNPGIRSLGDRVITAALSGEVITLSVDRNGVAIEYIDRLEDMLAAAVQFRFAHGSGGASCKAYLQTSFDQGQTWVDIVCAAFAATSATKIFNLSALTPKATAVAPTDGALPDDTVIDGLLGDRLRVKAVTAGNYAGNTLLSVRLNAR